jgi:Protein of unknown function (DUF2878).
MSRRIAVIGNALGFQLLWLLCVQGNNILAVAATAIALIGHWRWVANFSDEWRLVVTFALCGLLSESIIANLGLIQFHGVIGLQSIGLPLYLAPPWLVCLWAMMATTLRHSLIFLDCRPLLAVVLALVFVPLSYFAGAKISGSILVDPMYLPLLVEGLIWAVALPLAMALVRPQ